MINFKASLKTLPFSLRDGGDKGAARTTIKLLAAVFVFFAIFIARANCAEDDSSPAASRPASADTDSKPRFEYYGSTNCQRCHYNPIQQDLDDGRVYFLGMNESKTWSLHDRHSQAFKLLQCERGQAMGVRLGWDVTHDQRCLSCHADWRSDRHPAPDDDVLSEGVACEACHGPSSRYINDHSLPKWRTLSLTERSAEFGMTMLRDTSQRAKVCLSCHIGNAEQGKVITHEMYAAGHPPLPSFELSDFSQSMKHWDDIPNQLARIQHDQPSHADKTRKDLSFLQQQLGEDQSTVPALKIALYGAVLTLRQSVQLLADEAGGTVRRPANTNSEKPSGSDSTAAVWPEFALYDCGMCHHDLRYPAWRQARAEGGSPGRPQIPRWPQALVGVAIDQVSGTDPTAAEKIKRDFASQLANLDAPFIKQPFGNASTIAEPATQLTAFLDNLLGQMKQLPYDRRSAIAALRQLCNAATEKAPDYDSARQLAWAFETIYESLPPPGQESSSAAAATSALTAPNASTEKISQEVTALHDQLHLTLHPLQQDTKDACAQSISDSDLQSAMQYAATYSPDQFQQHFRTLSAALEGLGQ
jgi:hypothetical protein